MSDSRARDSSPSSTHYPSDDQYSKKKKNPTLCSYKFLLLVNLAPVVAALLLYQLDSFDPAPLPIHEFSAEPISVPLQNSRMLQGAERVGDHPLMGPEDLAYDPDSGLVYTGCVDGWIKRVKVNDSVADSVVEDWVNTGGRPLGLVLGHNQEVIVADADKGLLKVTKDGAIELLTNEAEGVKFKLTNGVDITKDGVIYFTDASYKYNLKGLAWDFFEGRPYGRFMSYDPSTKQTNVLVRDLYFANGVAILPDQRYVIFCETPMRRCKRYYLQGEQKGSVDIFITNLPGLPDNIKYNGEGQYWITIAKGNTFASDLAQRYPFLRKVLAIIAKYIGRLHLKKGSGVLVVDTQGKPITYYFDPRLYMVTTGIKIADYLYCGSAVYPYIIRLNMTQYPPALGTRKKISH